MILKFKVPVYIACPWRLDIIYVLLHFNAVYNIVLFWIEWKQKLTLHETKPNQINFYTVDVMYCWGYMYCIY